MVQGDYAQPVLLAEELEEVLQLDPASLVVGLKTEEGGERVKNQDLDFVLFDGFDDGRLALSVFDGERRDSATR
jgi:hypothetical protein